jgi:zinc protease
MQINQYPSSETIQRTVLPNGITVLVYENKSTQSAIIEGLVRAGALNETREMAGLANLTAVSLMYGTQSRTFEEIHEALESVGAEMALSSGFHTTGFSGSSLVEDFDLLLDLLADVLRHPIFPAEQVNQVRGRVLTGLQIRANDTEQMASLAFHELVYAGHPYGRSRSGYVDTVRPLTAADLAAFHRHYYGPQGMIITVVGGVNAAQVLARITEVLGDWHNPQQPPLVAVPDMPRLAAVQRTAVHIADKQQVDICLGLPGPRRNAPDYLDFSLANTILGVFGMMGRIGLNVREEQGLAYYAYSQMQGGLGPSPWLAAAGVAPQHIDQAIASILHEVIILQTELTPPEELADVQAYRIGSLPMALETNSGLADTITDLELYGLGLDYLHHFPQQVLEITPQRILVAAQKYLSTTQLGIAVAGSVPEWGVSC